LRESLGVKGDKPIPAKKLAAAAGKSQVRLASVLGLAQTLKKLGK
jgi:hypothetical protein